MTVTHQITVDFINRGIMPILQAVQHDSNTRVVKVTLTENGTPYTLPEGVTAALAYRKADGTSGLYDTLSDGTAAISLSGNIVSVTLSDQVLSYPGPVYAVVVLNDAAFNQLATLPFTILVSSNPSAKGVKSDNYYAYQTLDQINDGLDRLDLRISQTLGAPMAFVVTAATYIELQGYIMTAPRDSYITHRYRVFGGMEYWISGKEVGYPAAYPMALFTKTAEIGNTNKGTILVDNETATEKTDYSISYTPDSDGYIWIATYPNYTALTVSTAGTSGTTATKKTPLKIQVFGDSITNNFNEPVWPDFLAEYLPDYDVTMINSGMGGNTMAKYRIYPPYEWPAGTPITDEDGVLKGVAYQLLERASDEAVLDPLDTTADMYIICGGSNDYAGAISLGDFRNGDITTFRGAVQKIIEYVSVNTGARILFCTPLQRYGSVEETRENNGWLDDRGNILNRAIDGEESGYSLEEMAEAMLDTCGYYSIPCVDMFHESGISRFNVRNYANDGLHPNEEGARRLARLVAKTINGLV